MKSRQELRDAIYSEFKNTLDSTNELVRIAGEMMTEISKQGGVNVNSTNYKKAAAVLFSEAFSRFLAVKLLCEDAMSDMSLIMLRSQLNLFFIFYWILSKRRESRAKRYLGWHWKTLRERINQNPSVFPSDIRIEARLQYRSVRHLLTYKVWKKSKGAFKWKIAKVSL